LDITIFRSLSGPWEPCRVWTGALWSLYLSFCVTVGPSLDFSCGSKNVCVYPYVCVRQSLSIIKAFHKPQTKVKQWQESEGSWPVALASAGY